ncbi:FAD binding domain-containing protein [Aulographum hederae CBS 113979]|uniref:FAD binding domain-containing protein n=1 Tax=Aulographum hederae CBS 113979 TaxID=1176131 RepID=A0A6G1GY59_9PEZI|nr:FAD binding domain-containing protein [Aulographum hederae CBS 113979]
MSPLLRFFSLLTFSAHLAFTTADTCSSVVAAVPNLNVSRPGEPFYNDNQDKYWSAENSRTKPTCILSPKSAAEVSAVLKVIASSNDTFAVKSGGHSPNKYFNSIDNGPLISTRLLNQVRLSDDKKTAIVGTGNRWDEVGKILDGSNVTVVGGRIGNVGVGGYILGGGLSFLSTQYGWAANNIESFEVVLANSTTVNASETSHPDLYKALKGSGGGLGIVTSYTMKTYPIGEIWGGTMVFGGDQTPKLLTAIRNFTEHYLDPKAALIMTAEKVLRGAVDIWVVFLFYDGPTPPPNVFKDFIDTPHVLNDCKSRSYYDLLASNNKYVLHGSIYTIATETLPLPNKEHGDEVLGALYDHWANTTASLNGVLGLVGSIAFQPVPKGLAAIAKKNGGDMLDLDETDRIIIELDYSYLLDIDTARVDDGNVRLYEGLKEKIDGFVSQGKIEDAYRPLFMNDAYWRQDVGGRYRAEQKTMAATTASTYDPSGLFRRRTKGFLL